MHFTREDFRRTGSSLPLRLPPTAAGGFAPPKAAVSNCWPLPSHTKPPDGGYTEPPLAVSPHRRPQFPTAGRSEPNALTRGHRPWVEVAQNARQLEVGASFAKPPRGGCDQPPPAVSPPKAAVSTAGRIVPHAPRSRPPDRGGKPAQNARQLEVAGFICQAPLRGLVVNRPRRFRPTEGRSFQLLAVPSPTPSPAAIVREWKSHKTPGNWTSRASLAKPLTGLAGTAPAVSQVEAAVSNCRPYRAQRPPAAPATRGWEMREFARQLDVAGFACQAPCGGCD